MDNCWGFFGDVIHGAKGSAVLGEGITQPRLFKGHQQTPENLIWQYKGPPCNQYQVEHDLLFDAIRQDKPYNETERCANAAMTGILGRMAAESGQLITWEEAMASNLELAPGLEGTTRWTPTRRSCPTPRAATRSPCPGRRRCSSFPTRSPFSRGEKHGQIKNVSVELDAHLVLSSGPRETIAGDGRWIIFEGQPGPGNGKHIVFVTGDEEYRSEESMPMLAKILAVHHGFRCTVLFAIDEQTGQINPEIVDNIPGLEALDNADLMVLFLRFRELPDAQMKHIVDYYELGQTHHRTADGHAFLFLQEAQG